MSSDIYLNGITYPSSRKVAFPGKDGKEVVFDLPEDADAGLNSYSERPVQNKVIHAAIEDVRQRQTSPYNFKGSVAALANLPSSGNQVNDTYYVEAVKYRVTWTGSAWQQSSMSEADYADELEAIREETVNLWPNGDVVCEGPEEFSNVLLPAGTYTVSAKINRATERNCRVQFWKTRLVTKLAEPYILSGERGQATFTLAEDCHWIRFYSGLADTETDHTEWTDIQIEAGTKATAYVKPVSAVDSFVRAYYAPMTASRNLWLWGDQSFTKSIALTNGIDIAPGVYTLSAKVSSSFPYGSSMRVEFCVGSTAKATVLLSRGSRGAVLVDLSGETDHINRVNLYAANTSGNATGHTASFEDIQLEVGDYATAYVPPLVPQGYRDEAEHDLLYELNDAVLGPGTHNLYCMVSHQDLRNMVFDCTAKWTGTEASEYAVPEVRMDYSNLSYPSPWYDIGGKDVWTEHRWRMPPVPDSARADRHRVTIAVSVPSGLTLTVKRLTARYDDAVSRPEAGLRIDGHGSFLFYPEHSIFSMRALARCGASHMITIPKCSSDGVWFAYHDDTFDESTTILRNADGTAISGSSYDGKPFSQIPWSWLKGLDSGIYANHFGASLFAGARLMLISEMLELCNTTGVHPVFSCHPSYTEAETRSLRALLERYHLLDKTTLLPGTVWFRDVAYSIFGNDIELYKLGLTIDETSMDNLTELIDLLDSTEGLDKSRVCIALWVHVATEEMIETILSAGYRAGLHAHPHTTKSGKTGAEAFSAGDLRYWQGKGVTVFTDNHNPSFGLDW